MSPTTPEQAVIVVGAGPTGLTLACELAAAGMSCTVLERRSVPTEESRAMALYSRTMELLELRGHAEELAALGRPVSRMFAAPGAAIDFSELDSRFPYLNVIPQSRTEEVLQRHARDLGVTVERGAEVCGLRQDGDEVAVRVRTPREEWEERADYVVGCDGAHSAVRELSGIAFRGRTYDMAPVLADVRLRKAPPEDALVLAQNGGVLVSVPYGDGRYRLGIARRDSGWSAEPVTLAELGELLRKALGFDPEPYEASWLTRFRIHQRLADRYRTGRVLLAGDAAHLHSPLGGQGLNLGIQDAVNLGWKLAAELRGWAPPGLLDSYEAERRPHADRVLRVTDRATRLATSPSPWLGKARRNLLGKLFTLGGVREFAEETISGLRAGYSQRALPDALPGGLPLHAGQRLPDLVVPRTRSAPVRLYELMRDGRFLLLDMSADGVAAGLAEEWGGRVCAVRVPGRVAELAGIGTLLARPDGYAAWVGGLDAPGQRRESVRGALLRWCGPPAPAEHPAASAAAPPAAGVSGAWPSPVASHDGSGGTERPGAAGEPGDSSWPGAVHGADDAGTDGTGTDGADATNGVNGAGAGIAGGAGAENTDGPGSGGGAEDRRDGAESGPGAAQEHRGSPQPSGRPAPRAGD